MNAKKTLLILILGMFSYSFLFGQVLIKSEAASVTLNKKSEVKTDVPGIKIIFPPLLENETYQTPDSRVSLIGKIEHVKGVGTVVVANKETGKNISVPVKVEEDGSFEMVFFLEKGINSYSVIAYFDNHPNIEKDLRIEWETQDAILAKKIRSESVYYGLIIGINHYEDSTFPELHSPVKDAEKLKDILLEKYNFAGDNIIYLPDAKKDDILEALEKLRQKSTPNDNVLIFYAGHGHLSDNSDISYWLPADARQGSQTKWLSSLSLAGYIKEIRARHILLIADACFAGAIFNTRSLNLAQEKTMEELYDLPSRKAITSGYRTEVPDPSLFTRNLLEFLAEFSEYILPSETLFLRLKTSLEGTENASAPVFGKIQNTDDKGGDFMFVKK